MQSLVPFIHQFMRKILLFLLFAIVLSCNEKKVVPTSEIINSDNGVDLVKLNLIYYGPKSFTLDYLHRENINKAKIRECKVFQIYNDHENLGRKVEFDLSGNIIRDEYDYFQAEEGTVSSEICWNTYNDHNQSLVSKCISEKETPDSFQIIWNYNKAGKLFSRDHYEYSRKIKPNRTSDVITDQDREKNATWYLVNSVRFVQKDNEISIKTLVDTKTVKVEKYLLTFDSLVRLTRVEKSEDDLTFETTNYSYESNTITETFVRKKHDGEMFHYKSKVISDKSGNQIEKIHFNDDGTIGSRTLVEYNDNGTIKNLNKGWVVQKFEYSYY